MKRSWKETKEAIAGGIRGKPAAPDAFWEDFRARARLRRQEEPANTRPLVIPWRNKWAWVGTCAALLLAFLGIHMMDGGAVAQASQINSVEVVASHSGVLIMTDESSQSAILWIVDMEAGEENGDTS